MPGEETFGVVFREMKKGERTWILTRPPRGVDDMARAAMATRNAMDIAPLLGGTPFSRFSISDCGQNPPAQTVVLILLNLLVVLGTGVKYRLNDTTFACIKRR